MAVVIIFSSVIGFTCGLIDLTLLGGGFWGALQTYFVTSVLLSMVLGTGATLVRLRGPDQSRSVSNPYETWNEWHAEEDIRTGRTIAEIAKKRAQYEQSA